jgi:hypothetical protein
MSSREVTALEIRSIQNKINIYEQSKEKILQDMERYGKQGNYKLAGMISKSLITRK